MTFSFVLLTTSLEFNKMGPANTKSIVRVDRFIVRVDGVLIVGLFRCLVQAYEQHFGLLQSILSCFLSSHTCVSYRGGTSNT